MDVEQVTNSLTDDGNSVSSDGETDRPAAPLPATFDDPAEEADFQAAQPLLLHPPISQQKISLLVFSLWLREMRQHVATRKGLVRDATLPADEYWFKPPDEPNQRVKLIEGMNGFGYVLIVRPGDDPHARRMFDSFHALSNPRF